MPEALFSIDKFLEVFLQEHRILIYVLLFLVIFLETGIVIAPFLPGDSLIFMVGAFAAVGLLNPWLLLIILTMAAIIGDSVNYFLGESFGLQLFAKNRFFKKEYLKKTRDFYKKHGGKTIVIARFTPIVRTFAPFVAGMSKMDYKRFVTFNILGAFLWVSTFLLIGYFFGNAPIIKDHLGLLTLIILLSSLIPAVLAYGKIQLGKKK